MKSDMKQNMVIVYFKMNIENIQPKYRIFYYNRE